jgi:seryl-tRNA synthetase
VIDLARIEADPEAVQRNCDLRGAKVDVSAIVALAAERRRRTTELDKLRSQVKQLAKQRDESAIEQARALRDEVRAGETAVSEVEAELSVAMLRVPNLLDPRVPIGDEDAQIVTKEWGSPVTVESPPHDEIGEKLGLIDFEGARRIAGARFYSLRGDAVRLRYALIQLFLDIVEGQGFDLVAPPVLAHRDTFVFSGYLPFVEDGSFDIVDHDLSLVGTSEQPLISMLSGQTLTELPLKLLGDSVCFRTEAGSHGRDVRGMIRVHQFFKLEQIIYAHPDQAEDLHLECLANEEKILEALDLPYRTIVTASSDLAMAGSMKYDTEVWLPSQQRYREVTSNTNLRDFQTRRAGIRFKLPDGSKGFPYTISATGFTDRLIAAILESYWSAADGVVVTPAALRPYVRRDTLGTSV